MCKWVSIAWLLLLLQACDSEVTQPSVAPALNDGQNHRSVTVYLQAEPATGFSPALFERIVVAQPMSLQPTTRAEGKAIVQNVNTIFVGSSCAKLRSEYEELVSCKEVNAVDFVYGENESTAATDSEGYATLNLGSHEKYRISVQSWPTSEDNKCYWGGSEILEQNDSTLAIPVLVFCE